MKKNRLNNHLKSRHLYLGLVFFMPLLAVMCRNQERQIQKNKLDTQISTLDKKIAETRDFHTASVPKHLQETQSRYISATNSVNKNADTVGTCILQNEDLILLAFNNYAVRVGHDFQISSYLSKKDIAYFQQQIAQLDSGEYIYEMARQRILQNCGSLHDLSYFFEMLDFDSVNAKLENKLAWNFYYEKLSPDEDSVETSVLCFENPELNNVLTKESELLNMAWHKNNLELPAYDSVRMDTVDKKVNYVSENSDMPNFDIPEFDSVRVQYMHNDSLINAYDNTFQGMLSAEDTLEQYRQKIIRKRDSLIRERDGLQR